MFTGIVQGLCRVSCLNRGGDVSTLTVDLTDDTAHGVELGASIAINGCCLTVTRTLGSEVDFEVVDASLDLTNLSELTVDALVNVERALRFGDEIGGHVLSGHIACTVEVTDVVRRSSDSSCTFLVPSKWSKYLMTKGFIALNGASLTLAELDRENGEGRVNLIPETLERTNLGQIQVGSRLNMEVDSTTQTIVDTVERVLTEQNFIES